MTRSIARLIDRPVDDREIEIHEVGGVVRDERCPEPARERRDQEIRVVKRPAAAPLVSPELRCLHPHGPVVVDPLKRPGEGVQFRQLSISAAVTQAAPQLVEDDRAHEQVVVVLARFPEMREGRRVPAENLTDDVRVEDEAGHSDVDGTQAHAGAAQECVEIVPPLLAAVIGLGREPDEPPPERLILARSRTLAETSSRGFTGHWHSSLMLTPRVLCGWRLAQITTRCERSAAVATAHVKAVHAAGAERSQ